MREMQEALIASEEKRLEVGRALLDFRLEHTDALQAGEEARYELQQKVLNLEARLAEAAVTSVRPPLLTLRASELQHREITWRCREHFAGVLAAVCVTMYNDWGPFPRPLMKAGLAQGEGAALEAGRSAAHADLAFSHKQLSHTHRHVQELLAQVNELEAGKHALQQQCQEETLQLRQRLLSETSALHVRPSHHQELCEAAESGQRPRGA